MPLWHQNTTTSLLHVFFSVRDSCLTSSPISMQCAASAALADDAAIRVAVNQTYVKFDHPVTDGDEVALFPPVTGG